MMRAAPTITMGADCKVSGHNPPLGETGVGSASRSHRDAALCRIAAKVAGPSAGHGTASRPLNDRAMNFFSDDAGVWIRTLRQTRSAPEPLGIRIWMLSDQTDNAEDRARET
jgi:hypothetical protein